MILFRERKTNKKNQKVVQLITYFFILTTYLSAQAHASESQNAPPPSKSKNFKKGLIRLHGAKENKTTQQILATGTAVILGGVDATTISYTPRESLIQVMDAKGITQDLPLKVEKCHIIAYCLGDTATDRVRMEFDKISCIKENAEVAILNVIGHVEDIYDCKEGIGGRKYQLHDYTEPLIEVEAGRKIKISFTYFSTSSR